MFTVVYNYHVQPEKTKQYVILEKEAIKIYLEHGCLGVELYRNAKDPRKWMEINRFKDRQHYHEVIAAVDNDPRIRSLFEKFLSFYSEHNKPEKTTYHRIL